LFLQAHSLDGTLPLAKLGLAQIDLIRNEHTNAISLLESTLQDVSGWMDALKVHQLPHVTASVRAPVVASFKSGLTTKLGLSSIICDTKLGYAGRGTHKHVCLLCKYCSCCLQHC